MQRNPVQLCKLWIHGTVNVALGFLMPDKKHCSLMALNADLV